MTTTGVGAQPGIRAGVGRRKITPPVGVDLTGYIGRPGPSTRVHDDLYATAFVFDDGATRVGIISLDILCVDLSQDAAMRKGISEATGIDSANLLVACSHTHSGPATCFLRRCGEPDESYLRWAFSQVKAAVVEANGALRHAEMSFVSTTSDLGINRRSWVIDKGKQASERSGVITDPEVQALVIDFADGERALLFDYACHGVVMGGDNTEISADWIGAARAALESDPSVATAMFLQGCCGNINPKVRGTFAEAEEAGQMVARPLLEALPRARRIAAAPIRVAWETADIPFTPLPPVEEIEQQVSYLRGEIERKTAEGAPKTSIEPDRALLSWAQDALTMHESGGGPETTKLPLQAIALGEITLAAIPAEVFCEIGLEMKRDADASVMVVGYANGNIGYVPTQEAFSEGGYETHSAHTYYGIKMIAPESESILIKAMGKLLDGIGA